VEANRFRKLSLSEGTISPLSKSIYDSKDFRGYGRNLKKKKIILMVAYIGEKEKAAEVLLSSFLEVDRLDWKLVLAGPISNDFDKLVYEKVKNSRLKDNITLTGLIQNRDYLKHLYSQSAIFCLPSRWESFGIVLIEAASQGCFIVTYDLPAACDITNNWAYGMKIRPGNHEDLCRALRVATDEKNFDKIIENGRQLSIHFENYYSPEVVISSPHKMLIL
jgi:glycosyltransferase involved in cell wall biosynthesis